MSSFALIPNRKNGNTMSFGWFDILRDAGKNLEAFLGGGFIPETKVALANNQSSAASIAGLLFDHTLYTSVKIDAEVNRKTSSAEAICNGKITLIWRALSSSWDILDEWNGDAPGIVFSVTAGGQVQYTSDNMSGTGYVGNIKFKVVTFGV